MTLVLRCDGEYCKCPRHIDYANSFPACPRCMHLLEPVETTEGFRVNVGQCPRCSSPRARVGGRWLGVPAYHDATGWRWLHKDVLNSSEWPGQPDQPPPIPLDLTELLEEI